MFRFTFIAILCVLSPALAMCLSPGTPQFSMEEEAETVGCKMEHVIKGEVLDRFVQFLQFAEQRCDGSTTLAEGFRRFWEEGAGALPDGGPKGDGP